MPPARATDPDPGALPPMLDVAVVGGGVCGLAVAHSLQARRLDWALFEARDRLGGRVLTHHSARGLALDLGPSWYWPRTQPSMTRLVEDLKLASVAQADDGRVLWLDDPNRPPRPVALAGDGRPTEGAPAQPGAVHGGARRLVGGMEGLVRGLASALPVARLRRGHALECLEDHGDHVVLHCRVAGPAHPAPAQSLRARQVVLALPPRIVHETVDFKPGLPDAVRQALGDTPTWMATAAKAAVAYAQPFWRSQGHTGNAWVTHPQAVLAEVFDLGVPDPEPGAGAAAAAHPQGAALGGFLAHGVGPRQQMRLSLPLLIESQLCMLFGPEASDGEQHVQDWAEECWTCSPADRALEGRGAGHPTSGPSGLTEPLWNGRLLFGGSETAARGSGYLEGALNAAARVRRQLDAQRPPVC
jgi:monoamine oxidase